MNAPAASRPAFHPAFVLAALLATGCSDAVGPEANGGVVRIEVLPAVAVVLQPGDSVRFSATAYSSTGERVSVAVSWSSGDPSVARVDAEGLAIGVGSGTTTIQARADGVDGNATFALDPDVLPPRLLSVSIDKTRVDILNKPGRVRVLVDLADDRAGVRQAIAQFQSPAGASITGLVTMNLLTGTTNAGRYEGFLEVPANSDEGLWSLSVVRAEDEAGNVGLWSEGVLVSLGLAITFEAVWGGGG